MWNKWQKPDFTFPTFKNVHDHGADIKYVVMGALTTVLLLSIGLYLLITGDRTSPRQTENGNLDVAQTLDDSLPEGANELSGEQIYELLSTSEMHSDGNSKMSTVELLNERLSLSKILESKDLAQDLKRKATKSKLYTLSAVNFEILNGSAHKSDFQLPPKTELLDELRIIRGDSNLETSKLADTIVFQTNSIDRIASVREGRPEEAILLGNDVILLMRNWPNDDLTLSAAHIATMHAIKNFGLNEAKTLVGTLKKKRSSFEPETSAFRMLGEFSDELAIRESNLKNLYIDRWANGESGQKTLIQTCKNLLQPRESGMRVLAIVDQVAHWFEQEGRYSRATEIYQEMLQRSDGFIDKKVVVMAQEMANDGITRSKLAGQQIKWNFKNAESNLVPNSVISETDVIGKVVIVAFWSIHDPTSIKQLKALHLNASLWKINGIETLAVHVDGFNGNAENKAMTAIAKSLSRFNFLIDDLNKAKTSDSILAQCPGKRVPRFMLISAEGKVMDVNVPISAIDSEVNFLASQRAKQLEGK